MAMKLPLPQHLVLPLLVVVLSLHALPKAFAGKSSDGYYHGRATFYDDNQQGACHYGTNIPEWYAAWPDTMEGAPNCGSCWEIQCINEDFKDGYGANVDRSGACYDESKRIVVKIIDSCPCVHANYYSNKRWCCGDMYHIDLARKAFAELAPESEGVIGLKWRQASCDHLGVQSGSSSSNDNNNDNNSNSSNNNNNNNNSYNNNNNDNSNDDWHSAHGNMGGWGNILRAFKDHRGW